MKKLLVVFIAVAVGFSVSAAGEQDKGGTDAGMPEPFVLGKTPLRFSFFQVEDHFTAHEFGVDYKAEKWVKENLLVTIDLIDAGGAAQQKFSTMVINNKFPDRLNITRNELPKLINAGVVLPLDDYLPGSYFQKSMGEGAVNMLKASDGRLYQYPNWMITRDKGNGNGGWMVQKYPYVELGSPKIETFDDLYAYLKKIKESYPEMIPLAVTQQFTGGYVIFTGFAEDMLYDYIAALRAVPRGDKLVSIFKDDTFKEAVLYTARLFREKLIDQDSFTLNRDQDLERLPHAAVVVSNNICFRGRETMTAAQQKKPDNDWIPIWPVHKAGLDKNRIYPNNYITLGGRIDVITKDCENPEGVFRFMDWAFSPAGNRVFWFGPPGLYWEEGNYTPEGYPKVIRDSYFTASGEEMNFARGTGGIGNTALVDGMSEYFYSLDPTKVNWTKSTQINVCWKTTKDKTDLYDIEPATDSPEGIIYQEVEDIFTEAYSKAMFASSDAEVLEILARAEAEADAAGFDKLLDYMTIRWQDNKKKLAAM